ncbi:DGQHR domain-containing protein [Bacillus niacini]|uniref:DGQHR domain-containing protein n=1 Tax=Neobacillus niacini TaxID=86668 RepID=A0A852TKW3_9BACI|nr:DGQHR domain-containing protein [Neobacillus niacini]NYE08825.1 DGQHR domain-containing protein [Neobacillus niacini]
MSGNEKTITVNVFEVEQNNNVFYIGKIKASDLISIATVKWRGSQESQKNKYLNEVKEKLHGGFSEEEGIQRVLELNRLEKLATYIKEKEGIFPNSLIIALNTKFKDENEEELLEKYEEGFELNDSEVPGMYTLKIYRDQVNAFVVDGQHRLAAFVGAEDKVEEYDLVVTFFLNLEIPLQAEIFATINGNQRPVNKSLLYDLQAFDTGEYNEIKRCHGIVKWLNINEISPFYEEIKMLGTGYGSISQSAFIDELIKYVKERRTNKHKSFLQGKDNKEIIQLLLSYFLSISEMFPEEWKNKKDYVFLKTTGFGALMKLLYYVYIHFNINNKPFKKANLKEFFGNLSKEDFSKEKWGSAAGQAFQVKLFKHLAHKVLGDDEMLGLLDSKYKYFKEKEFTGN